MINESTANIKENFSWCEWALILPLIIWNLAHNSDLGRRPEFDSSDNLHLTELQDSSKTSMLCEIVYNLFVFGIDIS